MKNGSFYTGIPLHALSIFCMLYVLIQVQMIAPDHVTAQANPGLESTISSAGGTESAEEYRARMQWWKEARFGLFIHWGLYAIPAGQWKEGTNHAEWIRTTAQIPVKEYDQFLGRFNPVKFNAKEWVRMAKDAGMKYIVITTKHHDGFCLFDSKYTDFDVMSTPFRRDIMKELADAAHAEGIEICWYHSIMDWHHPDYLPRLDWEKEWGSEGADFERYVAHMKNQLRELTTNYGKIGVLWFDGEWGGTWDRARGRDLYDYVARLQAGIIINDRVGAGRVGVEGFSVGEPSGGDFGTPEQEIPATGLPGVNWETCMTMNDHWGYNSADANWKSSTELVRMLADIASKGGNFLLNVGPTAEGLFPAESVERLKAIGEWMRVNGEAIYGTEAGPFSSLPWGRCTRKEIDGGTRLFLHIFDWPVDGRVVLPGIFNVPKGAYLLSDRSKSPITVSRQEDALVVSVGSVAPDTMNSVVVLDVAGKADVADAPVIDTTIQIFINKKDVSITSDRENVEIRYTLDGSVPSISSPPLEGVVTISNTATVSARCFRDGRAVSGPATALFTKVTPRPAKEWGETGKDDGVDGSAGDGSIGNDALVHGVVFRYYEGDWDSLPRFASLTPVKSGTLDNFEFGPRREDEYFGFEYTGYLSVPTEGVFAFYTDSDDGSRLWIGDQLVVDNDGLHSMARKKGVIALSKGLHPVRVGFFEKTGGDGLTVEWEGPGFVRTALPDSVLFRP